MSTSGAVRLGLAGFAATAIAYGPGRVGYGLFLSEIRAEFGISIEVAGAIGSGLQAGYLLVLLTTVLLVARLGPRALVAAGGATAVFGMVMVALSPGIAVLAAGVLVTGMSAGFSWSPYSDLVKEMAPAASNGRVLSMVSTGTTLGIAASGLVALTAAAGGMSWRAAWLTFAVGGVVSVLLNAGLLGRGSSEIPGAKGAVSSGFPGARWLFGSGSAPLFTVAFSFGLVNAFYWSFNADIISRSSSLGSLPNAGAILYVVLGVAGLAGLFTGDLVECLGLGRTLRATLLGLGIGAGLLGLVPDSFLVVGISAVIYGAGVMLMSALMSVWSSSVFYEQPSAGFTATLLCFGVGGVVGPVALGAFGGRFGLETAFMAAAVLILLTVFVRPTEIGRALGSH